MDEAQAAAGLWDILKPYAMVHLPPLVGITFIVQGVRFFLHPWMKKPGEGVLNITSVVTGVAWLYVASRLALGGKAYGWDVVLLGGIGYGVVNIFLYKRFFKKYFDKILPSKRSRGTSA